MGGIAILLFPSVSSGRMSAKESTVGFLSVSASFQTNPTLYTAISLYFIFAGIVGWAILWRRTWAYDLAIVYCLVGLSFFGAMIALRIGLLTGPANAAFNLAISLGWFLVYLIRNRIKWRLSLP